MLFIVHYKTYNNEKKIKEIDAKGIISAKEFADKFKDENKDTVKEIIKITQGYPIPLDELEM